MAKNGSFYLSFTRVSTYLKCPQRYKFIYVDGLPTAPRSYFSFGNSIHKALEEFYKCDIRQMRIPPSSFLLELLDRHWSSAGYSSKREELRAKEEAKKLLMSFYRAEIFNYKPALAVEKEFSFTFEGYEFKGRIDRVDLISSDKIVLVDYKTNSISPSYGKTNGGSTFYEETSYKMEEFLQPLVYKVGAEAVFPDKQVERIVFHYLKHGEKVLFSIGDDAIEKGMEKIREVLSGILENRFTPKPNGYCKQCEFIDRCTYFLKGEKEI